MSFLSKIQTGVAHRPPRLLIYGTQGVGKTTIAAGAPNPIIIQTEDGADEIGCDRFPLATSFSDVESALESLAQEEHPYQTVVLDSVDWLERLVWGKTCETNGWTSIEQPGYGKGYGAAIDTWKYLLDGFDALRDAGMTVIFLAHSEVKRFDDPSTDGYERYQIAVHKSASALLQEKCDAVLFMAWKVITQTSDGGFNRKIVKGKGNGARLLYTEERPSAVAKNRFRMPPKIELPDDPDASWSALAEHLPFYAQA